ncbi:MAG TPA: GTPase [Humisphaera sp.]|nr:GTPase [Humisphaera sp.]
MTPALEQLVREAMEVTGAPKPELLDDNAPVLDDSALAAGDETAFYLVGLIGGKDVGKSALVNALVGKPIAAVTSHGAGTDIVIAYAHASQQEPLSKLLDRVAPGQFRIIAHDLERLRRQVLLDLPDIDSRYGSHLELTRTMLRHLLYPVWVASIEKYADQQPQQMLARVAEGNAPENFIFCLNKVDQLNGVLSRGGRASPHEDEEELIVAGAMKTVATPWDLEAEDTAITPALSTPRRRAESSPLQELRADYADRVTRTLKLPDKPHVYLISAKDPTRFELPALRELLSRQKTAEIVRESKQLAAARQDRALLAWLDQQQLALRAERLAQLAADAGELIAARVGVPVLERVIPRLMDDPAARMAIADDILQDRVARWPIVNLMHTLLQPIFVLMRSAVSRAATPLQGAEAMVDAAFKETGESASALVQSAFAQLRQSHPTVAALYPYNKLWENMPADMADASLRRALADTVERQRGAARSRFDRGRISLGAPIRWLLTIGALLWFPFVQPILSKILPHYDPSIWQRGRELFGLVIEVLGVDYLLKSAGFLIIYYAVLWLALRWNTQRKVGRIMLRWRATDFPDPSLNLAAQTIQWIDELTRPIRAARDQMQSLADRSAALRGKSEVA